ncbi:endo-1,5-alpha-L-arabinosidase [Bimuria novae-zelandiae CBS 107.79]|uniref:Arabinan endo-1,5-alpha-L-arabinosidase n=1 Tax=Bimuria novae-zelandiae CBS 107.79 TaxID=1447943 RepID=A0A6A5VMQ3_9PLEO|nr:endo-1,5-alpha-L-arabinosidase [Bimuria novae-zelandiae CBS 107.79]
MNRISSALLALAALATTTNAQPNPICSGLCTGTIRDPAVLRRSDGTWLRYTTEGNIRIATAPSISGPWTSKNGEAGAMLPGGSVINIDPDQRLWAPNVFFSSGLFYCHYSVSTIGSQNSAIGIATSVTGEPGNWTDHGSIGLPANKDWNRIDANFFRECPTCTPYFNFGSGWEHLFQTTLTPDLLKWSGQAPVHIVTNTSYPSKPQSYHSNTEGAFMWWLPNVNGRKYYYMFFSSGACCNQPGVEEGLEAPGDEYKIMVCRSENVSGPFTDKNGRNCLTQNGGSLVLGSHGNVYAPGGQGLAHDTDVDRVALYYMYINPADGTYTDFRFGFNWLDFSSGWPEVAE